MPSATYAPEEAEVMPSMEAMLVPLPPASVAPEGVATEAAIVSALPATPAAAAFSCSVVPSAEMLYSNLTSCASAEAFRKVSSAASVRSEEHTSELQSHHD